MSERIETMVANTVANEIMANASQFVQEMCNMGLVDGFDFVEQFHDCMFKFDYLEKPNGYFIYQDEGCGLWYWESQEDSTDSCFESEREATEDAFNDAGEEPPIIEAMEHWIVSDWLAEKLEEIEAPICRDVFGWNIWGRTETGQSLTMDSTLHDVARLTQWQIDKALERAS